MTQDFFLGQLRIMMIAVIAYSTGRGWLSSADSGLITSLLAPVGLLAGPWLWSIYRNVNSKIVPHDSIAIAGSTALAVDRLSRDGSVPVGATITTLASTAKVVGALLAGILLFGASDVFAADMMMPFRAFAVADIQAALDDAKANNDRDAVACYAALLPVVQSAQSPLPSKPGIFLAFQKARDIVNTTNQVQAGIGPLADVKRACASVLIDTQTFLIRLGVMGGGVLLK